MKNVKRYFKPNDIVFVTCVTYGRQETLIDHYDLLWQAIDKYKNELDFEIIAWVILPDHLHLLIDTRKINISGVIRKIKLSFLSNLRKRMGDAEKKVWQNRFWDHIIRDEVDLKRHLEYIHYNPVKHRICERAIDYRYSSFNEFVSKGYYQGNWGVSESIDIEGEFGE